MSGEEIKNVVRNAFDEVSDGYDCPALRFFDNSAVLLTKRLSLSGNERVLDVATGTGKIALALANRLNHGFVTGVDISSGMLSVAQRKASDAQVKNIAFVKSDIDALDFPPAHFDGVTCGFGVHFWPSMEQSLARLLGLVKANGFVAFTSFANGSFEPTASQCLQQFSRYGVQLPATYSIERLDHPDKNRRLFEAVGLKQVHSFQDQVGYYLPNAEAWWDLVRFTGYRAFLNQLNAAQIPQFKAEFLRTISPADGNREIFLNVDVITTIGVATASTGLAGHFH